MRGPRDHTSGSLSRSALSLALPSMTNHFLLVGFSVVDLAWVGRLGRDALAAVSATTFLFWCLFALTEAISIGAGSLVGRATGAGDRPRVLHLAVQGLLFAAAWSAVSSGLLILLLGPLLRWMGLAPGVAALGKTYATVLFCGSPAILGFMVLEAVFRGRGDAVTPFRALVGSVVLNALLDPLLIFGIGPFPRMGVAGAALAAVLTRGVAAGILLAILLPELRAVRSLRVDASSIGRMLAIGAPIALSGFLFSLVYVALARIVGLFGTEPVGALGIGHKMEGISFFTCVGFGAAAETLVAQNLGAGKPERAERAAWLCVGILVAVEVGFGLLFLLFARPFARLFSADPMVVESAAAYLRIMAWSQPLMGVEVALERAFAGAGKTLPPMAVSVPVTALRIPLAWLFAVRAGAGVPAIWWVISGTAIARGVLLGLWFRAGTWKPRERDGAAGRFP